MYNKSDYTQTTRELGGQQAFLVSGRVPEFKVFLFKKSETEFVTSFEKEEGELLLTVLDGKKINN